MINGAYTVARPITVNATAGPTTLGGIAAAASTFSGPVTLNEIVTLSAAASGSVTFSGGISGTGGVTAVSPGNGNVVLSATNSYSGATTVSSGQLTLAYSGAITGGLLPDSPVVLSGGTLDFSGNPAAAVNESLLSTTIAGFGATVVATTNGQALHVSLRRVGDGPRVGAVPGSAQNLRVDRLTQRPAKTLDLGSQPLIDRSARIAGQTVRLSHGHARRQRPLGQDGNPATGSPRKFSRTRVSPKR